MRLATLLGLLGLAVAAIGAAAALSAAAQEHATTRCTATPPGFPRELTRAEITVDWKVFPVSYECVYVTRDRIVRRAPP
jgi:hypothetical protein